MAITNEEVQDLNRERIDAANRVRAEAFAAKKAAVAARSWWRFSLRHSGQNGLKFGDYLSNEANDNLLTSWIEDADLDVTEANLEQAFVACRSMLASRPGTYERKTDTQQSRVFPQIKNLIPAPPLLVLPYTRKEVLSWSTARLHQEMQKSPEHVNALNRIIAGQN
jgi:hypothetical protein